MSGTQIPPGKTWFDTHKVHFDDVPLSDDGGISTLEFLDASEATTTLFDLLGSVAFTPVKNDMMGNVTKLRDPQALRSDLTTNASVKAVEPKPNKELADGFRASYKNTLAPHHGLLIKPIFSAAMSATPYRKDFYVRLGGEGTDPETTREALEKWVAALEKRVTILKAFLATKEAKW
ncbi:hypothetical protein CLAIMM_02384 [Cladophialophora immunda]|nr:hypothetical protein CLAIMM_02384 [Cladophialophora immunda]